MKNIAICFDGTWNTSDAPDYTNVVKTARLVAPMDNEGNVQVVFYVSGVGSEQVAFGNSINSLLGGAFGVGLLNNIEQAYRFLIFNHEPGDRIFVFGFSRGAFSARAFGGLLRRCGILQKEHVNKIGKAIALYKKKPLPDAEECMSFRRDHSVPAWHSDKEREWRKRNVENAENETRLQIWYMGIWDTVGALGVPGHWLFASLFNKGYRFFDDRLSSMVLNSRHALAIDEVRRIYDATPWNNLDELNGERGVTEDTPIDKRPYVQQWFPGDHGSVGGGGDEVGLSDGALVWVVEGAVALGLRVDPVKLEKHRSNVNHRAPLHNIKKPAFDITSYALRKSRAALWKLDESDLSEIARKRLVEPPESLPRKKPYLPRPLRALAKSLVELAKAGRAALKKVA